MKMVKSLAGGRMGQRMAERLLNRIFDKSVANLAAAGRR
jgi:hypothetical protein